MAYIKKKKEEKNTSEELKDQSSNLDSILKELVKQHNTIDPFSATSGGKSELGSAVTKYISTGSIALDTIIANRKDGGWPCGRIVELYSEPGFGKTAICFQAMSNCQREGGVVIFFDAERAASAELMEGFGVDPEKIVYSNLDKVEDIFQVLQDNLTSIINNPNMKDKKVFVVIDSLAAMKSKKLEEGTFDYNMNTQGEFAKLLGLALKRSLSYLHKANANLLIINQMRDAIGSMARDCVDPFTTKIKIRYKL